MHILKSWVVGACCAGLLLSSVSAADVNTIRNAYGLGLTQDVSDLETKLQYVQRTIHSIQEVELYNEVLASTTHVTLDAHIQDLTDQVEHLRTDILGGIDMPLEDIMCKEAEYTKAVHTLNRCLRAREFAATEPLSVPDDDLQELLQSESRLLTSLERSGDYGDVGVLDYFPLPTGSYTLTSPYGYRYDPMGLRGYTFHHGADYAVARGEVVSAWFSGVVLSTGNSYGSGKYVWLDHGHGVRSFYGHLDSVTVCAGELILQGAEIGLSGNTGFYTTGPHLHLGLYIDGVSVDPLVVLS